MEWKERCEREFLDRFDRLLGESRESFARLKWKRQRGLRTFTDASRPNSIRTENLSVNSNSDPDFLTLSNHLILEGKKKSWPSGSLNLNYDFSIVFQVRTLRSSE